MDELKINDYICLKLENNNTVIYVAGEKFQQCKYLLINVTEKEAINSNRLGSIDEITVTLNNSLESRINEDYFTFKMSPEVEFWAHCSNLQAWYENNYDTRLLHSNLAFPLLKKLVEMGDKKAANVFKEEIAKRIESKYLPVIQYLWNENFFMWLSEEELLAIPHPNMKDFKTLIDIENSIERQISMQNTIKNKENEEVMFSMNEVGVNALEITNIANLVMSQNIMELKNLGYLRMVNNSIESIPKSIGKLGKLKRLDLKINRITEIPNSISNCKNLKKIDLSSNFITNLPQSIGELKLLEKFNLDSNNISNIPDSIGNLSSLKELVLGNNQIRSIPRSIGNLKSLKILDLSQNKLTSVPNSIGNLSSLEKLYLSDNRLTSLPNTIGDLRSLKSITIDNNNELKALSSDILKIKSLDYIQVDYHQMIKFRNILDKLSEKEIYILKVKEKE